MVKELGPLEKVIKDADLLRKQVKKWCKKIGKEYNLQSEHVLTRLKFNKLNNTS